MPTVTTMRITCDGEAVNIEFEKIHDGFTETFEFYSKKDDAPEDEIGLLKDIRKLRLYGVIQTAIADLAAISEIVTTINE